MYEVGFLVVLEVDGIHGITGQQCLFRLFTYHFENRVKIDIDNLILYTHTQSAIHTRPGARDGAGARPGGCWVTSLLRNVFSGMLESSRPVIVEREWRGLK